MFKWKDFGAGDLPRYKGLVNLKLGFLEKYTHTFAGLIIAISGMAIKLLGI